MSRINNIQVGDTAILKQTATDETIRKIAEVSGDCNPVHLEEEYARDTIFRKRIAHGLFCQGMVSNVIGNMLPGEGSIFLKEFIHYRKPVYLGDEITCKVEVMRLGERKQIELTFQCENQKGEIVVDGTALVKLM